MKKFGLVFLILLYVTSSLNAYFGKKSHNIKWTTRTVKNIGKTTNSTRATRDNLVDIVILNTYSIPIKVSSDALTHMPTSFTKFLTPLDEPTTTIRSVSEYETQIVYSARESRSVESETYFACAYENKALVCLRDTFVLPVIDVKNTLPKAFTRFLYTREELEANENFYLLD